MARFRPDKLTSQIVFDITGGEPTLQTMHLSTIPNRPRMIKSDAESFSLRTDDIDCAHPAAARAAWHTHSGSLDCSDIAGARSRPMVNPDRPAADIMRVDDIDGSRPRVFRRLPHSNRVVNPVDPVYELPTGGEPPIEPPRAFIRDPMFNDDVAGAHPMPLYDERPPRDIMNITDIEGTRPAKRMRVVTRDHSSLDVHDINTDGIFRSSRVTNPLDPVYVHHGEQIRADDPRVRRLLPGKPDLTTSVEDIDGAAADTLTRKYRQFRRPVDGGDDEEERGRGPADILMVPSMRLQEAELEHQARVRAFRGERIRAAEERCLHAESGARDPIQATLRKQRQARGVRRTWTRGTFE
jgi:hypothetical protein